MKLLYLIGVVLIITQSQAINLDHSWKWRVAPPIVPQQCGDVKVIRGNCSDLDICPFDKGDIEVEIPGDCFTYFTCNWESKTDPKVLNVQQIVCPKCPHTTESCNWYYKVYKLPTNPGDEKCQNSHRISKHDHICGTGDMPASEPSKTATKQTEVTKSAPTIQTETTKAPEAGTIPNETTTASSATKETTTPPFIPPVAASGPMDY